ncbi:MAG: hypothetical protein ACXWWG_00545 [Nitrospira sp.]
MQKSLPFGLVSMQVVTDRFKARFDKIVTSPTAQTAEPKEPKQKPVGFGKRNA